MKFGYRAQKWIKQIITTDAMNYSFRFHVINNKKKPIHPCVGHIIGEIAIWYGQITTWQK